MRLATLLAFDRTVHVDGDSKYVFVSERRYWFAVDTRVVRFRDIARITYSFAQLPTAWDIRGEVHDTLERFRIDLELREGGPALHVAWFAGAGAAGDLSTWLMGDDLVDAEGTQAEDSQTVVRELRDLLGVELGHRVPTLRDEDGRTWTCTQCRRQVAPKPKCLYCGGDAKPS